MGGDDRAAALLAAVLLTVFPGVARAQDPADVHGHVWVEAPSGADITLDGRPVGKAPLERILDVAPGDHEVSAYVGGHRVSMRVDATLGFTTTASFRVSDAPSAAPGVATRTPPREARQPAEPGTGPSTAKLMVAGGTAAAALTSLGVAIGFTVSANNHWSNAATVRAALPGDGSCLNGGDPLCAQLAQENHARVSNAWAALAFYCVGGGLALAATGTWLFWPHASPASSVAVVPQVTQYGAGITVAWQR